MGQEMGREMGQMGCSPPLLPPHPPRLLPLPGRPPPQPPARCHPAAVGSEPPPSGDREPQGATHRACKPGSRQRTSSSAGAMVPRARGARSEASGRAPLPPGRRPRLRCLRGRGLRLDSGRTGAGSGGRPRPRRLASLRAAPRDPAPLRRAAPRPARPRSPPIGVAGPVGTGVPGSWAPQPAAPRGAAHPPARRPPSAGAARAVGSARRVAAARSEAVPAAGRSFPNYTPGNALGREKGGRSHGGGTPALRLGRGRAPLGGAAWGDPTGSLRMRPGMGPRRPEGTRGPAVVSTRGSGSLGFPDLLRPY